jgi:hypothetical protein
MGIQTYSNLKRTDFTKHWVLGLSTVDLCWPVFKVSFCLKALHWIASGKKEPDNYLLVDQNHGFQAYLRFTNGCICRKNINKNWYNFLTQLVESFYVMFNANGCRVCCCIAAGRQWRYQFHRTRRHVEGTGSMFQDGRGHCCGCSKMEKMDETGNNRITTLW